MLKNKFNPVFLQKSLLHDDRDPGVWKGLESYPIAFVRGCRLGLGVLLLLEGLGVFWQGWGQGLWGGFGFVLLGE
jgi:hypothetical protein